MAAEAEQGGVALAPFRKAPGFSKTPGTALIIPCYPIFVQLLKSGSSKKKSGMPRQKTESGQDKNKSCSLQRFSRNTSN